jgi:hypothetical protein
MPRAVQPASIIHRRRVYPAERRPEPPSYTWIGPVLVEHKFELGVRRRKAVVRMGFPYRSHEEDMWYCPFQFFGAKVALYQIEDGRVHQAAAEDGLHAVINAATAIRKSLERLKPLDEAASLHAFPMILDTTYGLDVYGRMAEFANAEIAKKERQWSRKRLRYEKSRRKKDT